MDFIYYWVVRAVGLPNLPTSFRWGFGWSERRPFGPLNTEESTQVDEMTRRLVRTHREKCRKKEAESCKLLRELDPVLAKLMGEERPECARTSNGNTPSDAESERSLGLAERTLGGLGKD